MEPLVSILIPAYNAERWLGESLESALAQTWTRKEVILVDDGSKDETLAIAQQFSSGRVKVVTQENQGAAAARNHALTLCQGEYIQWLDADDILDPAKISAQMETRMAGCSDLTLLSGPWAYFRYRTRRAKFQPTPLWTDLSPVEWFVRKWEHNVHMQTATWLISRQLTEGAGPWNTDLLSNDDGEYLCRIIKISDSIKFVPEARVFYRETGAGSLSDVGMSKVKIDAHFLGIKMQIEHVLSLETSERTRAACLKKLEIWHRRFYPENKALLPLAQAMALSLGGHLVIPKITRKYRWMQNIIGLNHTRRVRRRYNYWKEKVLSGWDAACYRVERRLRRGSLKE